MRLCPVGRLPEYVSNDDRLVQPVTRIAIRLVLPMPRAHASQADLGCAYPANSDRQTIR